MTTTLKTEAEFALITFDRSLIPAAFSYCYRSCQAFCSRTAHVQFTMIKVADLPLKICTNWWKTPAQFVMFPAKGPKHAHDGYIHDKLLNN